MPSGRGGDYILGPAGNHVAQPSGQGARDFRDVLVGEEGRSLARCRPRQDCKEQPQPDDQRRHHQHEHFRDQSEEAQDGAHGRDEKGLDDHEHAGIRLPHDLDVLGETGNGPRVGGGTRAR